MMAAWAAAGKILQYNREGIIEELAASYLKETRLPALRPQWELEPYQAGYTDARSGLRDVE